MNIFNFQKKPTDLHPPHNGNEINGDTTKVDVAPKFGERRPDADIPENVFVEYSKPKSKPIPEAIEERKEVYDLRRLYTFLETDLEKKGYEDALMNPDSSVMEEQIKFIKNELKLLISRVGAYYSGYLRIIDFHIETRQRQGMIETVDELQSYRATVVEETGIVSSIAEDANTDQGLCQNIVIGYKRGFRNGLAAISYNAVLGKRN